MLLKLIELNRPLDYVVFYDTGMEFSSIYGIRDTIRSMLNDVGVEFVELHPKQPFTYTMLQKPVKNRVDGGLHLGYRWCGGVCRWGTTEKLRAIHEFKQRIDQNVVDYVGIAADEQHRFDKAKHDGKQLPLVEWA